MKRSVAAQRHGSKLRIVTQRRRYCSARRCRIVGQYAAGRGNHKRLATWTRVTIVHRNRWLSGGGNGNRRGRQTRRQRSVGCSVGKRISTGEAGGGGIGE